MNKGEKHTIKCEGCKKVICKITLAKGINATGLKLICPCNGSENK